jgi:hypothetical protein
MAHKIVITAALTGVLANRSQCPYIPYSAEEIAEEGTPGCGGWCLDIAYPCKTA